MNNENLIDPNKYLVLSFEIVRKILGDYVEQKIRLAYANEDNWVKILYFPEYVGITVTELMEQNCFLKRSDLPKILNIFLQQWDLVFSKLNLNIVPVNIVGVISCNLEKLRGDYGFSWRQVYKITDLSEQLLECLVLNTNDIKVIRAHCLYMLSIEEMTIYNNAMLKKDSNVEMASYYELDSFGNPTLGSNYANTKGKDLNDIYLKFKN